MARPGAARSVLARHGKESTERNRGSTPHGGKITAGRGKPSGVIRQGTGQHGYPVRFRELAYILGRGVVRRGVEGLGKAGRGMESGEAVSVVRFH